MSPTDFKLESLRGTNTLVRVLGCVWLCLMLTNGHAAPPSSPTAPVDAAKATPALSVPVMAASSPAPSTASHVRYGVGLGRLLTTEVERKKIDDKRFLGIEPPKANVVTASQKPITSPLPAEEAAPEYWHLDGVSERPNQPSGQQVTLWIDGRAYLESELPTGLSLVRDAKQKVIGVRSKVARNHSEFAKIGEWISRPQMPQAAQHKVTETP